MLLYLQTIPDAPRPRRSARFAAKQSQPSPRPQAVPAALAAPTQGFQELGDLFEQPTSHVDSRQQLIEAAHQWGPKRVPVEALGLFSQLFIDAGGASVLFANCLEHDRCKYRYKISVPENSRGTVSGKGNHSVIPAVVRRDSANPVTRQQQREIRARGVKRPLDIAIDLVGSSAQYAPGSSIRKIRRRAMDASKVEECTVADIEQWCADRLWAFSENYQLPADPSKFAVVWKEIRANYVAISWAIPALLDRVVQLVENAPAGWDGFVGQCDYTFEVVFARLTSQTHDRSDFWFRIPRFDCGCE